MRRGGTGCAEVVADIVLLLTTTRQAKVHWYSWKSGGLRYITEHRDWAAGEDWRGGGGLILHCETDLLDDWRNCVFCEGASSFLHSTQRV
jgi:hypothetical protein